MGTKGNHLIGTMAILFQAMGGTNEEMEAANANVFAREEFYEAGPLPSPPKPRCRAIDERLAALNVMLKKAQGRDVWEPILDEVQDLLDLHHSGALV